MKLFSIKGVDNITGYATLLTSTGDNDMKKLTIKRLAKQKILTAINGRLQSCAELEELEDEFPSLQPKELEEVQAEMWKQMDRLSRMISK